MPTLSSGSRRSPRWLVLLLLVAVLGLAPLPGAFRSRAASADAIDCPCTIWPSSAAPATASVSDSAAVELGVKFRADIDGLITGVRFYKGDGNTGTHTGSLWSADGTRLAVATFTGESATGWQQVSFDRAVAVTAGTTYVASYYAPNGHYAADGGAFASAGAGLGPVRALADGTDGGNGVYRYGSGGVMPASTFNSTNYWVDVLFTTTAPSADVIAPTVSGRTPAAGATDVAAGTKVTAVFSEQVDPLSLGFTLRGAAGDGVGAALAWDEASRTMTYDLAVNHQGQVMHYREITQTLDDHTQLYRNLMPTPDGEHEVIRATYRRRS